MNIRPVLVVLPAPPVKAMTFATAGSSSTSSRELGQLGLHGRERDVLLGLDAADEAAGVLLGEEALGHDHEEVDVQRRRWRA